MSSNTCIKIKEDSFVVNFKALPKLADGYVEIQTQGMTLNRMRPISSIGIEMVIRETIESVMKEFMK